jgi:hypothetical protein
MNPAVVHAFLFPACMALFGPEYNTPEAQAMMLAIGMQESDFIHRQQLVGNHRNWWESLKGPATSFWQFEKQGIAGVLGHAKTGPLARRVLNTLGYPDDVAVIHDAIRHNDILAVAFARLLIFTHPDPLPRDESGVEEGWKQYQWCWRPGKPKRERWPLRYARAWQIIRDAA